MNVAIQGCFHGKAEEIFGSIEHIQNVKNIQIDLLLCCGDFQAIRNTYDMNKMACPVKYLQMGSFYKYYCGLKEAPCLTIIIGGNHEASNHLRELYFGGWVAPKIYFLGYSGCIVVKKGQTSIRIAGISGIFSIPSFNNSIMERFPLDEKGKYSIYHQKQIDIFKLLLYTPQKIDIFLSHDWPNGIEKFGNMKELLQKKKHFSKDIQDKSLGSPPLDIILKTLQPKYWFAAHLHVKYSAEVPHQGGKSTTKFLALDKCEPGRDYLQVINFYSNIDGSISNGRVTEQISNEQVVLYHDEEWLAIIKSTFKLLTIWDKMPRYFIWNEAHKQYQLNKQDKYEEFKTEKTIEQQKQKQVQINQSNFVMTTDYYNPFVYEKTQNQELEQIQEVKLNPQTRDILKLIGETGEELNHFLYSDPRQLQSQFQKQQQLLIQQQSQNTQINQEKQQIEGNEPPTDLQIDLINQKVQNLVQEQSDSEFSQQSIDKKIRTEELPFL